jgi:hypothetical protein
VGFGVPNEDTTEENLGTKVGLSRLGFPSYLYCDHAGLADNANVAQEDVKLALIPIVETCVGQGGGVEGLTELLGRAAPVCMLGGMLCANAFRINGADAPMFKANTGVCAPKANARPPAMTARSNRMIQNSFRR